MNISLSKLSTKDLATLMQRILTTSTSGKYPVIDKHPLLKVLQDAYAEYDEAYTKGAYSGKGKDVATADLERDVAYRNLKFFIDAYRKITSLPNYKEAESLYAVFKFFGLNIDRLSYSSETAQLKKLIEALETPENTKKLATLSLTTAFKEMKQKHEDFEKIYSEQAEANANLRQTRSATAIRKDLENHLKAYLNLLTIMKEVEGWKLFYADINELVKASKVLIPKKETEPKTPDPQP